MPSNPKQQALKELSGIHNLGPKSSVALYQVAIRRRQDLVDLEPEEIFERLRIIDLKLEKFRDDKGLFNGLLI